MISRSPLPGSCTGEHCVLSARFLEAGSYQLWQHLFPQRPPGWDTETTGPTMWVSGSFGSSNRGGRSPLAVPSSSFKRSSRAASPAYRWESHLWPFDSPVFSDYIKRLRYCEYLGKYFCQCCHENAQMVIPSRVLRKWDFSKYYVSNFSKDLLIKIWNDPLFNVQDINSALYRKVKLLNQVRVRPLKRSRHRLPSVHRGLPRSPHSSLSLGWSCSHLIILTFSAYFLMPFSRYLSS